MPIDKVSVSIPAAPELPGHLAQRRERDALFLEPGPNQRQAHETAQPQVWQLGAGGRQFRQCGRRDASLGRFVVDIDLQADIERWLVVRPLLGQAPRCLDLVDCVHPVKVFGDHPCFIALQVSDEVPGEVQIGQCPDLVDTLLDEVFAKITLPGGSGFANLHKGLFFAHREQSDACRLTAGLDRRLTQQITD